MQNGQQMRFTDDELALIKATFKDNQRLLKVLRKVFLPEIDPTAPLGQVIDLWMATPVNEVTPEYAYINWKVRNSLIAHVEQQLMQLDVLAQMESLSKEELAKRQEQDSAE